MLIGVKLQFLALAACSLCRRAAHQELLVLLSLAVKDLPKQAL